MGRDSLGLSKGQSRFTSCKAKVLCSSEKVLRLAILILKPS